MTLASASVSSKSEKGEKGGPTSGRSDASGKTAGTTAVSVAAESQIDDAGLPATDFFDFQGTMEGSVGPTFINKAPVL